MVRPILVPAYLILMYSGRVGRLGRFLGVPKDVERQDTAPLTGEFNAETLLTDSENW